MSIKQSDEFIVARYEDIPVCRIPDYIVYLNWLISTPLPDVLPVRLEELRCNLVIELPELPKSLEILSCNSVIALPEILPEGLKFIWCNKAIELPKVLPESLEYISCKSVIVLPKVLPEGLRRMVYNNSQQWHGL